MAISGMAQPGLNTSITWSPCGQFVAIMINGVVEVRDPLTFELLSTFHPTLTKPTSKLIGPLAYSPDGCSLACVSDVTIVIWDVQTGGVVKEIQHHVPSLWWCGGEIQLVWSLDGGLTSIGFQDSMDYTQAVHTYDIASGAALPPVILQPEGGQYLWAHNKTFRIIMMGNEGCTFNTFEVGYTLTKIESFPVQLGKQRWQIGSFSPTTYRVSLSGHSQLLIWDIQKSGGLLNEKFFYNHSFSSDGGHFAAFSVCDDIHIWKYNGGHYIRWREISNYVPDCHDLLFSPISPLLLGGFLGALKLWYLGGPSIASTTHGQHLGIFSSSGTYIITANYEKSTVTITNTFSKTPSQYIDTHMEISGLALIGNVLLVMGLKVAVAWLLTEEGLVDKILDKRRASCSDAIWETPLGIPDDANPLHEDQVGVIGSPRTAPFFYDAQDTAMDLNFDYILDDWGPFWFIFQGWHHLHNHFMDSAPLKDRRGLLNVTLEEGGWVTDHKGKHLSWLPIEWEMGTVIADGEGGEVVGWFPHGISTIQFESPGHYSIIIKTR